MTHQMIVTTAVLAVAVVVFIANRISPALVALGVAIALYAFGAVTFEQAVAGFGDPVVIYLAALFVVSEALEASGVTAWIGEQMVRRLGTGRTVVLSVLMLIVAALTALISVNGAVAALIPVAVMLAGRIGQPPAQLLMPLAFAAHAGSMLTLLGTPVNMMVSDLAVDAGSRPLGFFEFALAGAPLLVGTVAITVLLGPRLLPDRAPSNAPRDLAAHARTLAEHYGLSDEQTSISHSSGVCEVLIPPRSEFEGETVFPGMRTEAGDLVVVAVQRAGQDLERTVLRAGDLLVLRGDWDALENRMASPDLVAVDEPGRLRRQSLSLGPRAYAAVIVLVAMIIALAVGAAPPAIVALVAAAVMVLLRVVSSYHAQRAISIPTLLIVAGMIPLSTAIQTSGLAGEISDLLIRVLGGASPYLLQLGIVLVVVALGQFISNLATVLIVFPIALTVAETAQLSPLPLLMGITVAGAASFLTPVATAGNLMVQDPGGYRFGDYWKLGLPLAALFVTVAVLWVPIIWPFHP